MPLPIAVGGVSVSSEQVRPPYLPNEVSSNVLRESSNQSPYQSVTWAVCPRNEWQARTITSFYEDEIERRTKEQQDYHNGNKNESRSPRRRKRRMVEIRIQISPLVSAFSSKAFQERRYHLELFPDDTCDDTDYVSSTTYQEGKTVDSDNSRKSHVLCPRPRRHPQVVFSKDRSCLVILFFHPDLNPNHKGVQQQQSSILVFQLREPKTIPHDRSRIPLPSYIVNSKKGGSSNSDSNVSESSHSCHSPVVATQPKFVPCWGVTAICRLDGNAYGCDNTNDLRGTVASERVPKNGRNRRGYSKMEQEDKFHDSIKLDSKVIMAIRNDGTLLWVDAKSVQVIASATLPAPFRDRSQTNLVVRTMKTSPTSSFDRGILVIVIDSISSPRSSSLTNSRSSSRSLESFSSDESLDEGDDSGDENCEDYTIGSTTPSMSTRGMMEIVQGDCVLVEWSHQSTTKVQMTSLRRASTGTVSFASDVSNIEEKSSNGKQQSNERRVPRRSKSEGPNGVVNSKNGGEAANNGLQRTFQNMFGNFNKGKKIVAALAEKEERLRRKQHMDNFVLQELRTKRVSAAAVVSPYVVCEQETHISSSGLPQSRKKHRYPRRRSSVGHDGAGIVSDPVAAVNPRAMHLGLIAVWSPPSLFSVTNAKEADNTCENNDVFVGDVCFGSLPSTLCVVYHTPHGTSLNEASSFGPRQRVAQVLTLRRDTTYNCWDLMPTISLYLSSEQINRAVNVESKEVTGWVEELESPISTSIDESSETNDAQCGPNELNSVDQSSELIAVGYHSASDSFLINSIFYGDKLKRRWIACVWNWRSNAIGWMIQKSLPTLDQTARHHMQLSAQLYCGEAPRREGGSRLVYTESSLLRSAIIEITKMIVPMGLLSPTNSTNPNISTERVSLLLDESCVSFPSVSTKASDSTVRTIDWKIAALPLSYTTSHGSPQIAVIGPTMGNSIAVASKCGICILDTHHKNGNKWKQFGSPQEESSFSTLAMCWWEGLRHGRKDDERDDLLVALTQTRNGEQFLSCWSSKRLDLMHQLLDTPDQEWKPGESQDPEPSWGIPLPKDFEASNISILIEPKETDQKGVSSLRRAVVLVNSPSIESSECDYLVLQLQVFRNKVSPFQSNDSYVGRRPYYVMAETSVRGRMEHDPDLGPVSSVFIAAANFRYDLRTTKEKRPDLDSCDDKFLVTIGVNNIPGGIHAFSIFESGKSKSASLSKFQASKIQLSNLVSSGFLPPKADQEKFVEVTECAWNIELLNGDILSWSVPSLVSFANERFDAVETDAFAEEDPYFKTSDTKRIKGLRRPILICTDDDCENTLERFVLGRLCEVGTVSDWAFQSSSGCQFDISLGLIPKSEFGCVLRCGQNSHAFTRSQIAGVENIPFSSDILRINSHSQGAFTITPPTYVVSLYSLLLEAASVRMEIGARGSFVAIKQKKARLKFIQDQIQRRLAVEKTDSSMMALRLLAFRSLELISKAHRRHSNDPSSSTRSNLCLSQTLLSSVVDATRRCTSELQFASLFLEVGRQTEPSNLKHLFPLPVWAQVDEVDNPSGVAGSRTVLDLFTICIEQGSLAASASALPLFSSKTQARQYCGLLLDDAIDNIIRNSVPNECYFDRTEEERVALGDFFRFGTNLEDADYLEENMINGKQTETGYTDSSSSNQSISDMSYLPESPVRSKRNLICTLNASSSILNYVVPSSMRGESEEQIVEEAIRREASSFIKQSLDDPALDFALLPDWDGSVSSQVSNSVESNNVAGLVGNAILDLLHTNQTGFHWKVISALSKMILKGGIEIPSSYDLFLQVAANAQPLDIISIIPESYDVNNGIEENLTTFISEEIKSSATQIPVTDGDRIVDMALLLIERLHLLPFSDMDDQAAIELGLVLVILVMGYAVGRSKLFLEMMEKESLLYKCYEQSETHAKRTISQQ